MLHKSCLPVCGCQAAFSSANDQNRETATHTTLCRTALFTQASPWCVPPMPTQCMCHACVGAAGFNLPSYIVSALQVHCTMQMVACAFSGCISMVSLNMHIAPFLKYSYALNTVRTCKWMLQGCWTCMPTASSLQQ